MGSAHSIFFSEVVVGFASCLIFFHTRWEILWEILWEIKRCSGTKNDKKIGREWPLGSKSANTEKLYIEGIRD